MEIQDTPIYLDTRENYTTHDEFIISDAIESSPHTPTADSLQNTTSLTPDSSILFFKPKRSSSSKQREQSVKDEEHSTALGLVIPTTNRAGRMIQRTA